MDNRSGWDIVRSLINDESNVRYGDAVPPYMMSVRQHCEGVFFGTRVFKRVLNNEPEKPVKCYIAKPTDYDGHVLVVGGAGSGKSSCVAIPTLKTWGGSIFAIDIKGELTEQWHQIQDPKRPAKVFNLSKDTGDFDSYDPFHFLRLKSEEDNLVQNAREIAHAIVPLTPDVKDPFWIQSAQNVLTGAILYGVGIKASFNSTMTRVLTTPIWELIEEIDSKGDLAAKLNVAQFKGIKKPEENKMLTGISAELNNRVMVFVTNLQIKDAFTPNEDSFSWDDLNTHHIFMRIAEDKLGQYDGAISLMLTQLIRSLERRQDKRYANGKSVVLSADGEVIPPTLLLLDEFPRLGKVDVIQNAVSTLRSKGVTICLLMQSLAQLDRLYGKETRQIIVDNCPYKAILQITDPENQKIFSDMLGSIKVSTNSINESRGESVGISSGDSTVIGESTTFSDGRAKGESISYTKSQSESREPVLYTHEFATLKDIVLMTPKCFCRVDKTPYYNEKQ
jgi:type IV secretion system protein VirD4